ncbi:MAG TPA: AAA family ATPase [Acidimicrobiales bacterium]|nr:AAA family ATPase [Acidimicrobiales bacterium]
MPSTNKRPRRRRKALLSGSSRFGLFTTACVLLLLGAFLALLSYSQPHVGGDRLRLDTLFDLAQNNRLVNAKILNADAYVVGTYTRDDGRRARYNAPYLKDNQQERLIDLLLENHVPTSVEQQSGKRVANLAGILFPGLILILLFAYIIVSSRRGTGLFKVRSGARRISARDGAVTFADVAGQDAAVAELREIETFLSDPQRFASLGAEVPRGVLLYGPPGCGKTLLARALAGQAGANFYSISGSDFVELYVGVGAARVRDLFREARENAPAVIFIDELDSIGRARSTGAGVVHSTEQEQALNQVLAEMDGFSNSSGIIVLAATNRPDILDPALLRPGRFDRTVGLERPDEAARLAILRVHAGRKRLAPGVDLGAVARKAVGLTGADLAAVMNEAALLAGRAGKEAIDQDDLDRGLTWLLGAPERQRRLSMRDRHVGRRLVDEGKVTFADVAGQDAAVEELADIREFLTAPERYLALGASVPKGVLLYGPPGCGKTLLARALAGEVNAAFVSVTGPELLERHVGVGSSRIRDLFAEARQMAPAIVFIDEIDSLGRSRTGTATDRQTSVAGQEELNQILAEMDGFSSSSAGVIVLAATNRPDVLDPALIRPGRFDRTVGLELPTEEGRLSILELYGHHKVLAAGVDLRAIASKAHGLTGADLASIMNEAALLAGRRGRDAVGQGELEEALERTLRAPERQRRLSLRARSVGRRSSADERITFDDVAGVGDAIDELGDVRDYLASPERFAEMGATPPRGILLSGPPGCGKTLLARAVAGEANAAFISASASEFVEVFVGEGAARIRELFAEARSVAPAIVFIDELDAVGASRGTGASHEHDQTLNQLLTELDGFESRSAVVIIAATNRPDILDPALVRPGRFDRKVEITAPDRAGRRAILDIHAAGKPLAPDVDLDALAGLTRGFSGADLAGMLNEAAVLATRRGSTQVDMAVVHEALDRAYLGVTSRGHLMTDEERRAVAYHEAGHALVARMVEGAAPPYKLTIAPRGGTLGHCLTMDAHDRVVYSRTDLLGRLATHLGGYAAEKEVFGETGAGAASDIEAAVALARRMVVEYGMSDELGPLGAIEVTALGNGAPSEKTVEAIRHLADAAMQKAGRVLAAHRAALERVAQALLDRESLTAAELEELMAPAAAVAGNGNGGAASRRRAASGSPEAAGRPPS